MQFRFKSKVKLREANKKRTHLIETLETGSLKIASVLALYQAGYQTS